MYCRDALSHALDADAALVARAPGFEECVTTWTIALGRDKAEAKAAIRCSVGKGTTEQEIDQAIAIITDVIRRLRVTTHN